MPKESKTQWKYFTGFGRGHFAGAIAGWLYMIDTRQEDGNIRASATFLADKLNCTPTAAKRVLSFFVKEGHLERMARGSYRLTDSGRKALHDANAAREYIRFDPDLLEKMTPRLAAVASLTQTMESQKGMAQALGVSYRKWIELRKRAAAAFWGEKATKGPIEAQKGPTAEKATKGPTKATKGPTKATKGHAGSHQRSPSLRSLIKRHSVLEEGGQLLRTFKAKTLAYIKAMFPAYAVRNLDAIESMSEGVIEVIDGHNRGTMRMGWTDAEILEALDHYRNRKWQPPNPQVFWQDWMDPVPNEHPVARYMLVKRERAIAENDRRATERHQRMMDEHRSQVEQKVAITAEEAEICGYIPEGAAEKIAAASFTPMDRKRTNGEAKR